MELEHTAIKVVARLAPWLAPIPSGWVVGRAVLGHLAFPLPVAIITGLVVETLGLVSAYNWQWFADWNRRKLKSDPAAPAIWPAILGGFYLVVVIGLVVVLEVAPGLAIYALAALPLLALVGTVNLALIGGQEAREVEAAKAKYDRKRERQDRQGRKAEIPKRKAEARRPVATPETRQRAAAILAETPGISGSELGRQLGRSPRLGRMLRQELVTDVSGNGKG